MHKRIRRDEGVSEWIIFFKTLPCTRYPHEPLTKGGRIARRRYGWALDWAREFGARARAMRCRSCV